MDLARTLPRSLSRFAAGHHAIQGRRQPPRHWDELEARLLKFVREVKQTDLDRMFEYKTLKFGVYKNPLWQSMQHVVNHGTYHRGQITTMLRQRGAGQSLPTSCTSTASAKPPPPPPDLRYSFPP